MKKYKGPLILLNLVVVFLLFNWAVFKKEQTLKNGQLVLLELAPKDPRSLMQGDYMQLNYAMSRTAAETPIPPKGYFVLRLDQDHIGTRMRAQAGKTPLSPGEILVRYKCKDEWNIYIGAESYFFEEGKGERLANAKYGGLRVDKDGSSILIGLYDEHYRLLQP